MAKTIKIELSRKSINKAMKELQRYQDWVHEKETELRLRLATIGMVAASIRFSRAIYSGVNDVTVRMDDTGSVAVIYAEGESVAFIEFGTGARYGYGHPMAGEFGTGPGTWPEGKGHWDDPKGWWFGNSQHTYGNPPAMAMAAARDAIVENVTRIAKEVFRST